MCCGKLETLQFQAVGDDTLRITNTENYKNFPPDGTPTAPPHLSLVVSTPTIAIWISKITDMHDFVELEKSWRILCSKAGRAGRMASTASRI